MSDSITNLDQLNRDWGETTIIGWIEHAMDNFDVHPLAVRKWDRLCDDHPGFIDTETFDVRIADYE
jgi:hypothetical protein